MTWSVEFLIFCLVLMAISLGLGVGYAETEKMMGREVAQRNLRISLPYFLFGLSIVFLISWFGKYSQIIFSILYTVSISIWLLSWFFRRQEAGVLLLDIGKNAQTNLLFRVGLFEVAIAALMTWGFFQQVSRGLPRYSSLEIEVSKLAAFWSLAILFIAFGLSKLEFREKGICFMFSFIAWQRVKSHNWEQSKPNTLTIRFKPRYPLFPGFISMAIPANHRDEVSHILNEQLPNKNL